MTFNEKLLTFEICFGQYEPYFTGTTSASGSPYIFATGTSHSTSSGTGSGSSGNNTASNSSSSLGAGHPPSITLPAPPPQHFYTPPQQNHHQVAGGPATQDHLYYSIATAPPLSHQSHALGLTSDQPLLFYPTDVTCQQHNSSDSQATQEVNILSFLKPTLDDDKRVNIRTSPF